MSDTRVAELRKELDTLARENRFADMVPKARQLVETYEYMCCGRGESPEYVQALDQLGALYRNLGRYEDALETYKKVEEEAASCFGPADPSFATVLDNIAGLYWMTGRYEEAEQYCRRALEIYTRTVGPQHVLAVTVLNTLGIIRRQQGRFDEALDYFNRALEHLAGSEHRNEIATTYANMASVNLQQGQLEAARDNTDKALRIYNEVAGPDSMLAVGALQNLAAIHLRLGETEQAVDEFEKVYAKAVTMFGPDGSNTRVVAKNLAYARSLLEEA